MLDAGADKVSVNSAAVARPELIGELAEVFGAQCVVLAIDARQACRRRLRGVRQRRAHGRSGRDAVEWAREGAERGAGEILLTSMDRDGTEDGYELSLTRAVADAVDVPVIASGGAGTLDHLVEAVEQGGADAVLCASIFHYGQHTVREAKEAMRAAGIPPSGCDPDGGAARADRGPAGDAGAARGARGAAARVPRRRSGARPCAGRRVRRPRRGGRGRRGGGCAGHRGSACEARVRARALRHRHGSRGRPAVDLATARRERYPRAGRVARGGASAARRRPRSARLHDQRDGRRR